MYILMKIYRQSFIFLLLAKNFFQTINANMAKLSLSLCLKYTNTQINSHPPQGFKLKSIGAISRWLIHYATTLH